MAVAVPGRRADRDEDCFGASDCAGKIGRKGKPALPHVVADEDSQKPGSKIGIFPASGASIFWASASIQMTVCRNPRARSRHKAHIAEPIIAMAQLSPEHAADDVARAMLMIANRPAPPVSRGGPAFFQRPKGRGLEMPQISQGAPCIKRANRPPSRPVSCYHTPVSVLSHPQFQIAIRPRGEV
jgi:hypothetical protein